MTMTMRHSCRNAASVVLDGYSPTADGLTHGIWENRVYVCSDHAFIARRDWFPGMTPFTALVESAEGHACGEVWEMHGARG